MPRTKIKNDSSISANERFSKIDHQIIRQGIEVLPAVQQKIIVMHFWDGMSLTEIAKAVRRPWQSVLKEQHAAFKTLKTLCEHHPHFSRFSTLGLDRQAI